MQLRIWIITILLIAGLAACAPEVIPTPLPTLETELAELVPVTVERVLPTATSSPQPTKTAVPKETISPIPPTNSPAPTASVPFVQTTLTLPNLIWSENVENAVTVDSLSLEWSPVENEFVYSDCPWQSEPVTFPDAFVFLAAAPTFEDVDITPEGFSCFGIGSFIWPPSGQEIFFTGIQDSQAMCPYDDVANVELWRMDKTGNNVTFTDLKGWYLQVDDWLNDGTIIYSLYSGGMARNLMMYDLANKQEIANMWVLNPHVYATNSDYTVLEFGQPEYFNSVAIFSPTPLHEKRSELDDLGPNSYALSYDGTTNYPIPDFFSSYSDWLPNEKQVLVETWDKEVNILEQDTLHEKVIDLQLWDIEANTLELVAKGAFLGDLSPDGTAFAY